MGANAVVLADDDFRGDDDFYEQYNGDYMEYDEHHGDHDEAKGPYEELGELLGWGTVVGMGAAGVFFPIRRSMKWTIATFPNAKNMIISFTKFLGKFHVPIGITALILSFIHGAFMLISKGELESEGVTGLISFFFMIAASIFGLFLMKNKKAQNMRTIHLSFLSIAVIIGLFHIFIS